MNDPQKWPVIPTDFAKRGNQITRDLEVQGRTDDAELVRNMIDMLDWLVWNQNLQLELGDGIIFTAEKGQIP